MGILSWLILGLVAGYLGKMIHPGEEGGGWLMTMLLGVAGAALGGAVSTLLGLGDATGLDLWSIIIATAGSVLVLMIYYRIKGRRQA
ncbi:GlsB/YeaQ/YmgE family stress response membrane protein [Neolewinella agarilytica]|uniref:Uncharacterized membrane protein YeaQ/YmgE, transglycosylase-associated protein family n=1 Tax=Neolewinella agarilytica TaxID=478744 RepID=A0A1H9MWI8_9BACT|nr:GlsB/YeaQ/YmgE family stress response membrane protein [Neolewinella agarilytica]SER28086.1 Uncharacterized membrane protein YeaQ/YmgE, transglycosylase-associated protein family [Neolewinella agarilytica]